MAGAALLRGLVAVGPAVRAVPPQIRWRQRQPREPAQGRPPLLQVEGERISNPPAPSRWQHTS